MKKPYELTSKELISFREFSTTKSDVSSIPLGSYAWNRQGLDRDSAILELVELSTDQLHVNAVDAMEIEWSLDGRDRNDSKVERQLEKTGNLPPIVAYLDKSKRIRCVYLSSYIVRAARKHSIEKVRVWLMDSTLGYAMNRTLYVQKAVNEDLDVPADVLEEFDSGAFGLSIPLHCPALSDSEHSFITSSVGDRLEELYKVILTGGKSDVEAIKKKLRALNE